MKAVIDEELCIGCGNCEELCPEVFELGDDEIARVIGDCGEYKDCCEEAMVSCPGEAITIVD